MKVSELIGAQLDWAVAKAQGITDDRIVLQSQYQIPGEKFPRQEAQVSIRWLLKEHTPPHIWAFCQQRYEPSTDWSYGGPIIGRENITLYSFCNPRGAEIIRHLDDGVTHSWFEEGPTQLVAAMRCYVAGELGPEIELPKELQCV